MANLNGEFTSPNGHPYFIYNISYKETGRDGSGVNYKVYLKVRMSSSYSKYGYGISASFAIDGGNKVEKRIKNPSPMWSGSGWQGTWEFDLRAKTSPTAGNIGVNFSIWGTDGGSAPNFSRRGNVWCSAWNTAPYWTSDDGNINGIKSDAIIPENTGEVTINIPHAADKEGNTIYYDVWRYVNGKQSAKIASGTTATSLKDNLSFLGQGDQIYYEFKCHDSGASQNTVRRSWGYTKNVLTAANISGIVSINFNTSSIPVNLTGASNTNGDQSFSYSISSPNITIYNANNLSSNFTISIYKSGATPSSPYIKFEDLKNLTRQNKWQGSISINFVTHNSYGSSASNSLNLNIDLRIAPTAASNLSVGGYKTIGGKAYYIPSLNSFNISWNSGADLLGNKVLYDLYGRYEGGQWTLLNGNLSENSVNVSLEKVTNKINYHFKVVTKTDFNYTSDSSEKLITLDFWNPPNIYVKNPNRSSNEFQVEVEVSTNTSITFIGIQNRNYIGKSKSQINFSGNSYKIVENGLSETEQYSITISATDNSGLPNSTSKIIVPVSTYIPIVSIRKKGLGINTFADDVSKLKIAGRARAWAFVNEGYETNNPAGDHVNKWVKVASFRITGRYGDASATIDFLDSGGGQATPVSGRLKCRAKQQNEMGKETYLGLYLENPSNCNVDDFYLVVTRNVANEVVTELWYRCSTGWTSVYFYPSQTLGEVTMYSRQPFQDTIPSGQNLKASYSTRETLFGLGAMGATNKNGYWGFSEPTGSDVQWIRTTQLGLIPYQSGGSSSLGTSSWRFNEAHINTIYENGVKLQDKYIPTTGGKVNGRLDIGNDGKRLTMGVGDYDAAIGNTKTGKWLQLKDDGRLCYSEKEILDKGHFSTDRSLNGYQYLPNGLLMQWGYVSMGKDTTKLVNLKKSFADNNYNLQVSTYGGPGRVPATKTYYINKNNFYVQCEGGFNVYWFAIGAV